MPHPVKFQIFGSKYLPHAQRHPNSACEDAARVFEVPDPIIPLKLPQWSLLPPLQSGPHHDADIHPSEEPDDSPTPAGMKDVGLKPQGKAGVGFAALEKGSQAHRSLWWDFVWLKKPWLRCGSNSSFLRVTSWEVLSGALSNERWNYLQAFYLFIYLPV